MERFYKRTELTLQCEVVTPMFLGGADQEAEWRAAPFKALLRSWWRVTQHGTADPKDLAAEEGRIFGQAGNEESSGKSCVRLCIQSDAGAVDNKLPECGRIKHPEKGMIKPLLYLANMGLVNPDLEVVHRYFPRSPTSEFSLTVSYPSPLAQEFTPVLALIQAFGAVGGRCRNGWGSFRIVNPPVELEQAADILASTSVTRDWKDGFSREYPNCLGKDEQERPLLWKTQPQKEWELAMRDLADAYIRVRADRVPDTTGGIPKLDPGKVSSSSYQYQERHLLGIPLTNHLNKSKSDDRHASPLRFVVKHQKNRFRGYILHVPHAHSTQQTLDPGVKQLQVWETVHRKLDGLAPLLSRATYKEVLS